MDSVREHGMQRMLADIEAEVAYTRRMIGRDALDEKVMQAMAKVPRDAFVPEQMQVAAFDNGPLPIGHGQTISQPYIVALMTDLLAPQPRHRVLEIGTGSGYQTAVLALLCATVYSMDLIPSLTRQAAERLARLGQDNVQIRSGNGYAGWPDYAPYDGIIVTAAAPYTPQALIEQLKPGGRLVIPLGQPHAAQRLVVLHKDLQGQTTASDILGVAFVPLIDQDQPS